MHQWQKFGKNLSIDTGDIVETWKSGMHSVTPWPWTLTFWPQNLISSSLSQDAPVTKVWRKSVNRYWRYRGNIKLPRESRMDGRTTRKHIASAGAYRRRRLKNVLRLKKDVYEWKYTKQTCDRKVQIINIIRRVTVTLPVNQCTICPVNLILQQTEYILHILVNTSIPFWNYRIQVTAEWKCRASIIHAQYENVRVSKLCLKIQPKRCRV